MDPLRTFQASTLLEALVALVIVGVLISITLLCFENAWSQSITETSASIENQVQQVLHVDQKEGVELSPVVIQHTKSKFSNLTVRKVYGMTPTGDTIAEYKQLISDEVQ